MKPLGLNEIREKYLSFFASKEHLRMNSFPLIPQNDKSLLLINAGMAPLKPYFTGQQKPPKQRVTTCQKCIRTGDIENVGKTARHLTFFEMLGNFSFGDYFKIEAIKWAWEFSTVVLNMPQEKIYVTVYENDDEAYEMWNKQMNIPTERIVRLGKDDNFWEIGVGPCGPCSELYFDRGEKYGCGSPDCKPGCDCDRFMEFWNLVFTQFDKDEEGNYNKLQNPNIDTGMGLERISAIMQGVDSVFDVDTIKNIRDKVCEIAKVKYNEDNKQDVSIRIVTDHIRSTTTMISDGILPSNEGRGYVLRRLLRRAARHGMLLGIKDLFLTKLSEVVIENSKFAYSELEEKKDYIIKVITNEEERFKETIEQGMEMVKDYIKELKENNKNILEGSKGFKLYDTYGFPLDLTKEILEEEGMTVDEKEFEIEMENQKQKARSAREETNYMGVEETVYNKLENQPATTFVGYVTCNSSNAQVLAITNDKEQIQEANLNDKITILVDTTPFYAQSGGQKGDKGVIKTETGEVEVTDCIKILGNKCAHIGKVVSGTIKTGQVANLQVNSDERLATSRNHSATHLLQKALREVLGNHVEQAGSYVTSERVRFDFTHFSALTQEELQKVEDRVNEMIFKSLKIDIEEMGIQEAKNKGAMALFGEKYGNKVRVVSMGDYSIELCGGTHLTNTIQAGMFKIVSENGVSAGVRRIEALTGTNTINYYKNQEQSIKNISAILKTNPENITKRLETILVEMKEQERKLEQMQLNAIKQGIDTILSKQILVNNIKIITYTFDKLNINEMRTMADEIKEKIKSGVIMLASKESEKVSFIVVVTEDIIQKGIHAGNLAKQLAQIVDGNGGGRPNMAQAGGKLVTNTEEALAKGIQCIKDLI